MNKALQEKEQGTLITAKDQTLKSYLESWLEEVKKPTIRISSYVKYRKLIFSYIIPVIGDIKLQKLTPQHVNALYRKKEEDGLKPKTINSIHGVLHGALENAVKWELVAKNVCDVVTPPRVPETEQQVLSKAQALLLLEQVKAHRLEAFLTLALTTGMRRGEILALRWKDVNFEEKSLQVMRTVDYIPHYGYVETEPKTKKGRRKIMLASFVVDTLKAHQLHQTVEKQKLGTRWVEKDLVFCGLHGDYFNPRYLHKLFSQVLVDIGLPHMRFHDLRHSAATILLGMGVNAKAIQELLGHSDISITLGVYGHLLPSMQQDVVDRWDDVFQQDEDDTDNEDEDADKDG